MNHRKTKQRIVSASFHFRTLGVFGVAAVFSGLFVPNPNSTQAVERDYTPALMRQEFRKHHYTKVEGQLECVPSQESQCQKLVLKDSRSGRSIELRGAQSEILKKDFLLGKRTTVTMEGEASRSPAQSDHQDAMVVRVVND